jgi:hypothetical protein
MRTLRFDEPRYAREDAYRSYRERDRQRQRHPAHSPQRAPRRRELIVSVTSILDDMRATKNAAPQSSAQATRSRLGALTA